MYGIGLNTMHKINKIDAALKQKAMYDPCLKKIFCDALETT